MIHQPSSTPIVEQGILIFRSKETQGSFIVSLQHITSYTPTRIEIKDVEVPIGGMYKLIVLQALEGKVR